MDRALLVAQLSYLIYKDISGGAQEPFSTWKPSFEIRRHWRSEITKTCPDLGVCFESAITAHTILRDTKFGQECPYIITGEPAVAHV